MRIPLIFLSLSILFTGCEQKAASPPAPVGPPMMQITPQPKPMEVAPVAPTTPPPEETVKAAVGVGKAGRSLDEHEGIIVTPVKSLFAAKEMIAFEILVPSVLNLFMATEGRFPKSHEEFWEKVIVANNLAPIPGTDNKNRLPELPAGHTYWYNAETHELMVKRPAKQ